MPGLSPGTPAVVVAGGPNVAGTLVTRLVKGDGHFLLCADGGAAAALKLGLVPDLGLGDFDSLSAEDQGLLAGLGCPVVRYPVEKDETDSELALDYLLDHQAGPVTLTGALGGRFDHALANLALLPSFADRGLEVVIDDGDTMAFLVSPDRPGTVEGEAGDVVSLFPETATCAGVTLDGLKYPLSGATLRRGATLGVSNQLSGRTATVRLFEGRLFVIVTRMAAR
ncbi:MAG: thiamine diphosphokinase [Bacillota bacterium]